MNSINPKLKALKSIQENWEEFAKENFKGVNPPEIQVREMRKAFFAGAVVVLAAGLALGHPDISEDEGAAYLDARLQEFKDFSAELDREYRKQAERN